MTSYDGTVFKLESGRASLEFAGLLDATTQRTPRVDDVLAVYAHLKGTAGVAIAEDEYDYTIIDALRHDALILGCFLRTDGDDVDADDTDNLAAYLLDGDDNTLCYRSLAYGLPGGLLCEVSTASVDATRTLSAGATAKLRIAGSNAGAPIPDMSVVVLYKRA